jgi:hypothetical protein
MVLVGLSRTFNLTIDKQKKKQIKIVEEIAWEDNKIRGDLNMFLKY